MRTEEEIRAHLERMRALAATSRRKLPLPTITMMSTLEWVLGENNLLFDDGDDTYEEGQG